MMSFLGYLLMLILYVHVSNARHMGVLDKELYNQNDHIFGKGSVQDQAERGINPKAISPSSMSPSEKKEKPQGNDRTVSLQMGLQEATDMEEWRRQDRRILPERKSHDHAEETVDSKENDGDVEDVVVMDYAQPHRKTPIHNKDP